MKTPWRAKSEKPCILGMMRGWGVSFKGLFIFVKLVLSLFYIHQYYIILSMYLNVFIILIMFFNIVKNFKSFFGGI